ncbi:MAG: sulfatase-like hydrolase/transferase [Spirochaetaceae bacterium]|nr:sulfatase-like hydrolase/transferase [Spirochaetaceae bacterium]
MSAPPDIVWVMCDQLRWDAVGYAGNGVVRTPNIDRLAARGAWFESAYCASPLCSPARASWLTGTYPHTHGLYNNYAPSREGIEGCTLSDDAVTIGGLLKEHGYACGNVGVWHLSDDAVPAHGFDDHWCCFSYIYENLPGPFFGHLKDLGVANPYALDAPGTFRYGREMPLGNLTDPRAQRTTWTVDQALGVLARSRTDPLFLLVGIKDPHPPIIPPSELLAHYSPERLPLPGNFHDPLDGKPPSQTRRRGRVPPGSVTTEELRTVMRYYYALVTHIDRQIGRLVEALERAGRMDRTIFVVNSDHGEMLGNHGFVEKALMYEESVRVPCLISWPEAIPAGQRVAAPLAGVDLAPTLLELAGAPVPDAVEGRSLAQAITTGTAPQPAPVFAEVASAEAIYRGNHISTQYAAHVMVRDGGWKYVWNRFEIDELYDLAADPSEMDNLAASSLCADRLAEMRRLIVAMLNRNGPGLYDWCARSLTRGRKLQGG